MIVLLFCLHLCCSF